MDKIKIGTCVKGIENAHLYGHWYMPTCNIGFCPRAWEMMFDAVDSLYLGLEWEPSHQLEQMISVLKAFMTPYLAAKGKWKDRSML